VALSPGMQTGIRKVIGESREVVVVPNAADVDRFCPELDGGTVRKRFGWEGKFILGHFGAMGQVNGLEFVIRAAEKLTAYEDILFVLVGEGKEKGPLTATVGKKRLTNVQILAGVPKTEIPEYFAACDVGLVIIGNYPIIEQNSANKFFDSLAAGKPVLLNYSGWQRQTIDEYGAGLGCKLYDLDEFVENVLTLYNDRSLVAVMGRKARKLAEDKFSRDILSQRVLSILENIDV